MRKPLTVNCAMPAVVPSPSAMPGSAGSVMVVLAACSAEIVPISAVKASDVVASGWAGAFKAALLGFGRAVYLISIIA